MFSLELPVEQMKQNIFLDWYVVFLSKHPCQHESQHKYDDIEVVFFLSTEHHTHIFDSLIKLFSQGLWPASVLQCFWYKFKLQFTNFHHQVAYSDENILPHKQSDKLNHSLLSHHFSVYKFLSYCQELLFLIRDDSTNLWHGFEMHGVVEIVSIVHALVLTNFIIKIISC